MASTFGITEAELKKYIRAKMDGKDVPSPLSKLPPNIKVEEPKIPTKEELQQAINQKIPSQKEIEGMAEQAISGKIPQIPNIWFTPPTLTFNTKKIILLDPFINLAKVHLLGTSGTMMVMAQYPPPAPPAPAIIPWQGYMVRNGPPIPPIVPPFKIPKGMPDDEKNNVTPEAEALAAQEAEKQAAQILTSLNQPVIVYGQPKTTPPKTENTLTITGGQTITDKTLTQNNINKNKC